MLNYKKPPFQCNTIGIMRYMAIYRKYSERGYEKRLTHRASLFSYPTLCSLFIEWAAPLWGLGLGFRKSRSPSSPGSTAAWAPVSCRRASVSSFAGGRRFTASLLPDGLAAQMVDGEFQHFRAGAVLEDIRFRVVVIGKVFLAKRKETGDTVGIV